MKQVVQLLIPLLIVCVSCSPKYQVFTQRAVNAPEAAEEGDAVAAENEQVFLRVTSEKSVEDLMAYEVYVKNIGDTDVLIDPTSFYVLPLHLNGEKVAFDEELFHSNAYAPEKHMEVLEGRMKKFRTRFTGYQIFSFLLKSATLAAMGTAESQSAWNWLNVALTVEEGVDAGVWTVHRDNMNQLYDQVDEWESVALQRHTLPPGEESWGIVLFQIQPAAGINRLIFPLGDKGLAVDFRQQMHMK